MAVEPLVVHADLELYASTRFRALLAARPEPVCAGVTVRQKEPDPGQTWPAKLLVVRFDGSTKTSIITDEASLGFTVFAGTLANPKDANDLARLVRALIPELVGVMPSSPVAAVLDTNGPLPVPDAGPMARRYISTVLRVVGSALP